MRVFGRIAEVGGKIGFTEGRGAFLVLPLYITKVNQIIQAGRDLL